MKTDLNKNAEGTCDGERFHARAVARHIEQQPPRARPGPKPPPEEVAEWWLEVEGQRVGPVDVARVRQLWEDGVLCADSLCWRDGFASWVALFRVSELAEALAPRHTDVRAALRVTAEFARSLEEPEELEWQPSAAAQMEERIRERLVSAQVQRRIEPEPLLPALPVRAAAPQLQRSEPRKPGRLLRGLALMTAMAAAGLGGALAVRMLPQAEPPALPPAVPAATQASVAPPVPLVPEAPPRNTPKPAPARERAPRPVAAAAATTASAPAPEPKRRAEPVKPRAGSVDEAFMREFAVD